MSLGGNHGKMIEAISINDPKVRGYISYDVPGLDDVVIAKINGLLRHTGQVAHDGLSGTYYGGNPVIYVDTMFFKRAREIIQKHETDEILQWENLRFRFLANRPRSEMRKWIIDHITTPDPILNDTEHKGKTSRQLAKEFHKAAYSLDDVYKLVNLEADIDYGYIHHMLERYGTDEESADVNIAASKAGETAIQERLKSLERHEKRRYTKFC